MSPALSDPRLCLTLIPIVHSLKYVKLIKVCMFTLTLSSIRMNRDRIIQRYSIFLNLQTVLTRVSFIPVVHRNSVSHPLDSKCKHGIRHTYYICRIILNVSIIFCILRGRTLLLGTNNVHIADISFSLLHRNEHRTYCVNNSGFSYVLHQKSTGADIPLTHTRGFR